MNEVGFVRLGTVLAHTIAKDEEKKGFGDDEIGFLGSQGTLNAPKGFSETRSERSGNQQTYVVRVRPTPATPVDNEVERVATHLASALRDEKSIAYFRLVARVLPREVICDALTRALDARSVRRSRGALFAHLVRPHLQQDSITKHRPS